MINKFDKPYRVLTKINDTKNKELLTLAEEMDIQNILQYSLINKIPLPLITDSDGNNLINRTIMNPSKIKTELNRLNFIKYLVQNQVNPDQPNKDNQTPLHLACQNQYYHIINYLLELKVNINYQDNNGSTPLHYILTGEIKLYNNKEITDFIIPNPSKNKIDKNQIIKLKTKLVELIKNDNANYNILNYFMHGHYGVLLGSKQYKKMIDDFIIEVHNINNNKLLNDKILNLKKKIFDNECKLWGNFTNSPDFGLHPKISTSYSFQNESYGLIKNYDVKAVIKNCIKSTVDMSTSIIDNYKYNETNINLLEPIIKIYNNHINVLNDINNINPLLINGIQLKNNYNNLDFSPYVFINNNADNTIHTKLNELLHPNVFTYADNFIDLTENYFIGGSQTINIGNFCNHNYFLKLDNVSYYKKIIYICLLDFYFAFYNSMNIKNYDAFTDIHNHIRDILLDPTYGDDYDTMLENLIIDFHPDYNNLLEEYVGQLKIYYKQLIDRTLNPVSLYSDLTSYLCMFSPSNLQVTHTNEFFVLMSALFMNPKPTEDSFSDYIAANKISFENFKDIIINSGFMGWIKYIFDDETKFGEPISNIIDRPSSLYIMNTSYAFAEVVFGGPSGFVELIKNDTNKYASYKQIVCDALNDIYNNLKYKFPKMILDDLLLCVKYDNLADLYIDTIKNNNDITYLELMEIINNNVDNIPATKNSFSVNYMPELEPDILDDEFFRNKFYEAHYLKIYYRGMLPVLHKLVDDNYFILSLNNNTNLLLNPDIGVLNNIIETDHNMELLYDSNPNPQKAFPYNYIKQNINTYPQNIPYYNIHYGDYYNLALVGFGCYRPPLIDSVKQALNNNLKIENEFYSKTLHKYSDLLKTLFTKKQKINSLYISLLTNLFSVYTNSSITTKIIKTNNLFDYNKFINCLEKINAYIYVFYYIAKNGNTTTIPEFVMYPLSSNFGESDFDYNVIYNMQGVTQDTMANNILVGGNIIYDYSYIMQKKYQPIPPSVQLILPELYQFVKKKEFIQMIKRITNDINIKNEIKSYVTTITNILPNHQETFIFSYVITVLEELYKNIAETSLNSIIDNFLYNTLVNTHPPLHSIGLNIKPDLDITITFKQTIDNLNNVINTLNDTNKVIFTNLYNINENTTDENTTDENTFIIYPNEYTNMNILKEFYSININNNIINNLLNNGAQPLLLDNDNNSCIINILKTYNYSTLNNIIRQINYFNNSEKEINFILKELDNHKNKLINIDEFVKPQYEQIKLLILNNNTYGNIILYNLKLSFNVCFYLMMEYLTDYLWEFNEKYIVDNFKQLNNFFNYENNRINNNYLNILSNDNLTKLYSNDIDLIMNEQKNIFVEKINESNKIMIKLNSELNGLTELGLDVTNINNKIAILDTQIIDYQNKLDRLNNLPSTNYTGIYGYIKTEIISAYEHLANNTGNGVYYKMWELLFNDHLDNSWDLSLLNILNNNKNNILNEIYFDHISELAYDYFNKPKFINSNDSMKYIYDLLIHLTKRFICFDIEIVTRRILYNHFINLPSFDIDDIYILINRLFDTHVLESTSFNEYLYNHLPEKLVKNSINIYIDLDEKINFESQNINELLLELFNILRVSVFADFTNGPIFNNLTKNVTNYFNLFTSQLINNWYVICENVFKFIINHQRIIKTHNLLIN